MTTRPTRSKSFAAHFDESWDANYDLWPDRWVRQTGLDYPHYVDVQIRDDDDAKASGGRLPRDRLRRGVGGRFQPAGPRHFAIQLLADGEDQADVGQNVATLR